MNKRVKTTLIYALIVLLFAVFAVAMVLIIKETGEYNEAVDKHTTVDDIFDKIDDMLTSTTTNGTTSTLDTTVSSVTTDATSTTPFGSSESTTTAPDSSTTSNTETTSDTETTTQASTTTRTETITETTTSSNTETTTTSKETTHTETTTGDNSQNEQILAEIRAQIDAVNAEYSKAECVGFIQIKGLISATIFQTDDNIFYIYHSDPDTQNKYGTPFMDWHNEPADLEKNYNTVIYAHNVKGIGFGDLADYIKTSKGYLDKYPTVRILTYSGLYEFEIFSVYQTQASFGEYFKTVFSSDEAFVSNFDTIREHYLAAEKNGEGISKGEGYKISASDRILTLSTCASQTVGDPGRTVLHAKLIRTVK